MPGFNPDKFLAETAPSKAEFNPDKFLAETLPPEQERPGLLSKAAHLGGAILDYPFAPVRGAFAGAVDTIMDKDHNPTKILSGFAKPLVFGPGEARPYDQSFAKLGVSDKPTMVTPFEAAHPEFGGDLFSGDEKNFQAPSPAGIAGFFADAYGGHLVSKGVSAVPGLIRSGLDVGANKINKVITNKFGQGLEYTPTPNKEQVLESSKRLGIPDLPKAILTDNPTFHDLESGLSQSGSLPAKETREQYNTFHKSLKKAADKIEQLSTQEKPFASGKSIQGDLSAQVDEMQKPVKELYNQVLPDMRKIPVDKGVVNKAFGILKRNPLFLTQDGQAMLEEYKQITQTQPELASLKEFRSTLRKSLSPGASRLDKLRIGAIEDAVTSVRDNSVEALKASLPAGTHAEIDDLISQIALADAGHAGNIKDLNSIKSIIGNREIRSPGDFIEALNKMKESEVAERAANLDITTMRNMKNKFPSIFEQVKEATVNDLIQSSQKANGFNDTSFLKKYNNMDQEMRDLLFSPEMQTHINDLHTVKQAIPPVLGPSGTPKGLMTMDMFNPRRNVLDYGIKKTLSSVSSEANAASAAKPVEKVVETAVQATKGPEKWVNDGIKKIQEHDASIRPEVISEAVTTKKGKDLLIKASDLTPGSKAMEKVNKDLKLTIVDGGKKEPAPIINETKAAPKVEEPVVTKKEPRKIVSMYDPDVQDLRQEKFGKQLEPIGKVKDQVRSNRKNFPELKAAPPAPPQSKFAMTNDGQTPWDHFRERVRNTDGSLNSQVEKAIKAAGKSDQPYAYVGDSYKAIPSFPNENVSASKVIGKPEISETYNSKAVEQVPWTDNKYQVTKKHLASLKEPVTINTSSDLIAREDYIKALPKGSEVNIYTLTPDAQINSLLFPGNPSRGRLDSAFKKLKESGVNVKLIEPTVDDIIKAIENKTLDKLQFGTKSMSEVAKGTSKVDKFLADYLGINVNTSTPEGKLELSKALSLKTKMSLIGKSEL